MVRGTTAQHSAALSPTSPVLLGAGVDDALRTPQNNPARFGISSALAADRQYEIIFSAAYRKRIGFDLDDYAYVFATPYKFTSRCAELYDMLVYQCKHWVEMHAKQEVWLSYEIDDSGVTYRDSRYREAGDVMSFGPLHARIQQRISDRIAGVEELCAETPEAAAEEVMQALEDLDRGRLLYREGNRVLGLAIRVNCHDRWRARAHALEQELAPA